MDAVVLAAWWREEISRRICGLTDVFRTGTVGTQEQEGTKIWRDFLHSKDFT
jgi:hypothetical protein